MIRADALELRLLAKVMIVFAILSMVAGMLLHGVSFETPQRIWQNLVERPSRTMSFRFIVQPSVAAIIAIGDGIRDAKAGQWSYLWNMFFQSRARSRSLREALNATARILLLGLIIDVVYQLIELPNFYPFEAILVPLLLAFVPYLLIRELAVRIAVHWRQRTPKAGIR